MLLQLVLIVIALTIIYTIVLNKSKPHGFPPGPPRLPFWGSYWYILKENYYLSHIGLEKLAKKYKTNILGFYLGSYPAICTFDMATCKELLSRDEFTGKSDGILVRARGQGKQIGIFFVDGLYWKDQRRFALRHLRDYGFGRRSDTVEQFTESQIRDMIDLLLSDPRPNDEDICRSRGVVSMPEFLFGHFSAMFWWILSAQLHDYRRLRDLARDAMGFQRAIDSLGGAISMTPWLKYLSPKFFGYTSAVEDNYNLYKYCEKIVNEHLETYDEYCHRDLIDDFIGQINELEAENNYTTSFNKEQLIYLVLDLMFPPAVAMGHTTNFLFGYLLNYPDVQVKIQEELDRVVGRARLPTLNDRKDCPYTEAVIREIIRKEPANPIGLARRCTEDTTLGGYFIPKDTIVCANVNTAHNDPEYWDEPELFKPERWILPDGTLTKKDPTMGFGAGKRLCAGETFARQTMFLFVSGMVQNFTFVPPKGEAKPDLSKRIWGINQSLYDYWMEAKPRA